MRPLHYVWVTQWPYLTGTESGGGLYTRSAGRLLTGVFEPGCSLSRQPAYVEGPTRSDKRPSVTSYNNARPHTYLNRGWPRSNAAQKSGLRGVTPPQTGRLRQELQRRKWRDFATSADYHQRRAAAHHAAFTWSGWRGARPNVETLQSCKRTAYPRSGKRVRNAEIATLPPPHAASCAAPPPHQAAVARPRVRGAQYDVGISQTCAHAARMGAGNTPKSPKVGGGWGGPIRVNSQSCPESLRSARSYHWEWCTINNEHRTTPGRRVVPSTSACGRAPVQTGDGRLQRPHL